MRLRRSGNPVDTSEAEEERNQVEKITMEEKVDLLLEMLDLRDMGRE